MDDIWNSDDLCFDTPAGESVDQNGCSEFQKDDDQDGYVNAEDDCSNTPLNNITDDNGCSLIQLDSLETVSMISSMRSHLTGMSQ
jgi:hypothetical protein